MNRSPELNWSMVAGSLRWIVVLMGTTLWLAGCSTTPAPSGSSAPSTTAPSDPSSRYTMAQDRGPTAREGLDVSNLPDAVPRYEAPRNAGNRSPYTVWGQQYTVMDSADGYVERGTASWYGKKFHGHQTSNGEVYNMYAMSAAHKHLPLPTYVRVTNLENGRSVVVRVNDRGPFHGNRLIDLSWAAANRLGFLDKGTAQVEVAAITVRQDGSMTLAGQPWSPAGAPSQRVPLVEDPQRNDEALFVQLASFSQPEQAQQLENQVRQLTRESVRVRPVDTASGRFHRVQVGPFTTPSAAATEQRRLQSEGFSQALVLTDRP